MNERESALPDVAVLVRLGEHLAAGFFEEPDGSYLRRWSRGVRRRLECESLPSYEGGMLYPCGERKPAMENCLVEPSYSFTWTFNAHALDERLASLGGPDASREERAALLALRSAMTDLADRVDQWDTVHHVGGKGYTHSIPNYGRVLREGLNEHARRVERGLADARSKGDAERGDFYESLGEVLAGIRVWHRRILDHLAAAAKGQDGERAGRLVEALARVPFEPARTLFEAVVAYNFTYYLDDCDNPGRIDQELHPFYVQDMAESRLDREEARALLEAFTENVCANWGWSAAIGGTREDAEPAYNDVTLLCMEAVHDRHRPNYELRVRRDMPDAVWDAALDALSTGCGQPALYNEEGYLDALRDLDLGIAEEDLVQWNGGGCTETMIHGCSNVGSLDAGIHLPLVFEETLERCLATADGFQALLEAFKEDVARTVRAVTDNVSRDQELKARYRPQPMRSLLIDDCIDEGVEFNAGGARYNWSVVNVAGLSNVADSLAALREVVFERGECSGAQVLAVLRSNFKDEEPLRRRLAQCPRFGNDEPVVDMLAADLAAFVAEGFLEYVPWRGGRFLPSCIMFETYGAEGKKVGATPDGRLAGQPLADSIGPYQGRDVHGPTAMLRSVSKLPLHLYAGTPVVNIRFGKGLFTIPENRKRVRELVAAFFAMGGLQLQVSVVDGEVLRDAVEHPERHEDLIVRIGGYSTYFNRLSAELKQAVIERSAHAV